MAWSRVKNLLIVMLIAVNAFLMFVYGFTTWRENRDKEQVHQDLIAAVSALGVTLDEALIAPEVQMLYPVQVYEDHSADLAVAKTLLGTVLEKEEDGNVVYQSDVGVLRLQNGGWLELELVPETPIKTEQEATQFVETVLKGLKQTGKKPVFSNPDPGQTLLATVELTLSGMPVFNAVLDFEFYPDVVVVSGKRVLHKQKQVYTDEVQELPGVLLSLLGYWEDRDLLHQTITGIELGYLTENRKSERLNVFPVWHIAVENGDWYVNALDGSIASPE